MFIPLAWGAFNGYRKGLLVEIVAVIAFIVAMIVGFKFLAFGIDLLSPYISREIARKILPWLGFSVIFFPTVFMINQMGFAIRRSLKFTILGTFDSVAGAAVGVFTWVFGMTAVSGSGSTATGTVTINYNPFTQVLTTIVLPHI